MSNDDKKLSMSTSEFDIVDIDIQSSLLESKTFSHESRMLSEELKLFAERALSLSEDSNFLSREFDMLNEKYEKLKQRRDILSKSYELSSRKYSFSTPKTSTSTMSSTPCGRATPPLLVKRISDKPSSPSEDDNQLAKSSLSDRSMTGEFATSPPLTQSLIISPTKQPIPLSNSLISDCSYESPSNKDEYEVRLLDGTSKIKILHQTINNIKSPKKINDLIEIIIKSFVLTHNKNKDYFKGMALILSGKCYGPNDCIDEKFMADLKKMKRMHVVPHRMCESGSTCTCQAKQYD